MSMTTQAHMQRAQQPAVHVLTWAESAGNARAQSSS
eukprot:CAMPEP_0174714550 /NCGR_PEP_ID=MMETSP1094-20130205/18583_1 /TAXON_ID=156173 /ORGANISM="Chrysochromulina brevifilum, Strain UTEX LB 985" /LENGTH=35 /DNA_ID= /DNA_START= /DNA_END= /DNA_ORIENTATION=